MRDTHRIFNVTLNPDISTGQTDREIARTTIPIRIIDPSHDEARDVGNSVCGGLCVRATLEEDKDYKDITVRISDSSACSNYENVKNKRSVVKFCTPLVCKESSHFDSSKNELLANEGENSSNMIDAEIQAIREANKVETANLSSKINENLVNDEKTRAYRDKESNEGIKVESPVETKRAISYTNDETLRYDTSETPKCFCRNYPSVDKNENTMDTLVNLRKLLDDAVGPNSESGRNKCERSRSVPRGRSRERDFDYVRSNLSFPVCIDYSEAALTAADLTRPEFVKTLTEIKEYARNLERQLSHINNAMKGTCLNDTPSGIARLETDKKKVPMTHDKIDENENTNQLSSSVSKAGISDNEKKSRKKKITNKDASSQSDIFRDERASSRASSLKRSKKFGLDSAERIRDEETSTDDEAQILRPTLLRHRDAVVINHSQIIKSNERNKPNGHLRVSGNRIVLLGLNEASSTGEHNNLVKNSQYPEPASTANEAVMVKPSKIHKLKKPVESSKEKITCLGHPKLFSCANRELSPADSRSPTRLDASFFSISGKSLMPNRGKSASTQSSETRAPVATSVTDLHLTAPPTTPADSEHESGQQRDHQPSRYSQNRRVSSRSRSKNRKNEESPKRDEEIRSHGGNSNKTVSVHDSMVFNTLHDAMHASDRPQNYGKTGMIEIDRSRMTQKPVAFDSMKKSTKLESTNTKSKVSCNRTTCGHRKPETARIYDQSDKPRTINNSSQSRKLNKPADKLLELRTPGIEYLRGEKSITDNVRRSPGNSSKSPSTRSRKIDATEKLLGNYPTSKKRSGIVKTANNVNGILRNNSMPNSEKKLHNHQRSRSDPRESRNYSGRNSR